MVVLARRSESVSRAVTVVPLLAVSMLRILTRAHRSGSIGPLAGSVSFLNLFVLG